MKGVTKDPEKKVRERTVHTAAAKCRAVLSVWSERRKPQEVCREMGIQWSVLNQWQERALGGMLGALEPRNHKDGDRPAPLGARLQKLLDSKTATCAGRLSKLSERLARIQETHRPQEATV